MRRLFDLRTSPKERATWRFLAGVAGMSIGLVGGPRAHRLVTGVHRLGSVRRFGHGLGRDLKLKDNGVPSPPRIDWWGNVLFAVLTSILVGITCEIEPYGTSPMGWVSPRVIAELAGGVALLVAFAIVETQVAQPVFRLGLFRIHAFLFGNLAEPLAPSVAAA